MAVLVRLFVDLFKLAYRSDSIKTPVIIRTTVVAPNLRRIGPTEAISKSPSGWAPKSIRKNSIKVNANTQITNSLSKWPAR